MNQHLISAAGQVGTAVTVTVPFIFSLIWVVAIFVMVKSRRTTGTEVVVLAGGGIIIGATFPELQGAVVGIIDALGTAATHAGR